MASFSLRTIGFAPFMFVLAGCITTGNSPESTTTAAPAKPSVEMTTRIVERGDAALAHDDFEGALTMYQRVLRQDPENSHARLGAAESYLGMGLYEEALRAFREAGDDQKVGVEALQGKGIVLLAMGEFDKAYEALSAAVAEQPDMWRSWNALGRYHDARGAWTDADKAYRNAMDTAPTASAGIVSNNWGVSEMTRGQYEDAVKHFSQAVSEDQTLAVAKTNLRLALAFQGRYAEAMSGVRSDERAGALNNLGFVAMMQGDHARAEAYFLRAMESSPNFHEAASRNLEFLASMKQIQVDEEEELAESEATSE